MVLLLEQALDLVDKLAEQAFFLLNNDYVVLVQLLRVVDFLVLEVIFVYRLERGFVEETSVRRIYGHVNGVAIKSEISKLRGRPECFICANDFIARSVCDTLQQLQIDIPKQCMVVGYDNVAEASAYTPSITSFGCDKENLGMEAASALLNRINHSQYTYTRSITVHTKAVYHTSTER